MRIDLLAPPYSGHLHPVLGLAQELAGEWEVRVLSTPSALPRIRACGLRGASLLDAGDEALLQEIANPAQAVRSHPVRLHRQFRAALGLMARLHEELLALYRSDPPDLLIADFTVPSAGLAAQALGIPWWTSLPSPCVLETPDGPPAYMGGLRPAGHWGARLGHAALRRGVRGFKRLVFGLHRGAIGRMGLHRLYRADGSEAVYSGERILALGVQALEFPCRWPAALRFVGPRLCTPPQGGAEPPFAAGRRHVLVTMGTHLQALKGPVLQATQVLARALPEVVFHFSDGEPAATAGGAGEGNFWRLPWVDYGRHLHRYDLVVHHGGAGVMYHGLAAGIPAVVYPMDYDQFDHAARLEHARAALWLRNLGDLEALVRQGLRGGAGFEGLAGLQRAVREALDGDAVRALVREALRG